MFTRLTGVILVVVMTYFVLAFGALDMFWIKGILNWEPTERVALVVVIALLIGSAMSYPYTRKMNNV